MSLVDLGGVTADNNSFDVMPPGKYVVEATDAIVKDTRAGTGQYIKVTFSVLEPSEFANRKMWQNFNIKNPNPEAVEIGKSQLKGFMESAGMTKDTIDSVHELIGLKTTAHVVIERNTQYGDSNRIKYHMAATDFAGIASTATATESDGIPF